MIELQYKEPEFPENRLIHISELFGLIQTISVVPTHVPKKFNEQIILYASGVTYRLYIYDVNNNAWRYSSLT